MKLAVDTETTGLHWTKGHKPFGIGIYSEDFMDYIDAPVSVDGEVNWDSCFVSSNGRTLAEIRFLIENADVVYMHNAKFDLHMLAEVNIHPHGKVHDTMFMSRVCNNREKNFKLKPLAKKYLNIPNDDEEDLKKAIMRARTKLRWTGEKTEELYWLPKHLDSSNKLCEIYCLRDVERTYKLAEYYLEGMDVLGVRHTYDLEMELIPVIQDMERTGVIFFRDKAEEKFMDLQTQLLRMNMRLKELYGDINFNSHQQVSKLLLQIGVPLTERTEPSDSFPDGQLKCGAKILADFQDEFRICKFLVYRDKVMRSLTELKNYLDCDYNGCIHGTFNQCNAVTWRFSMTDPNLMKTTKKEPEGAEFVMMRDLFGPREDYVWVAADYEQIELRIFADSSQEPHLLEAFRNGKDVHDETTDRIPFLVEMGENEGRKKARGYGKNTNFTIVNGGGANALWKQYRIPRDQGKKCIEGFKEAYPDAHSYMENQVCLAEETGYIVTKTKRRLFVDPKRVYTTAINYDIQPSAGDIMKQGLLNCYKWLKVNYSWHKVRILLSIHDELVFEIHKSVYSKELVKTLKDLMEAPSEIFCIPIPVSCELITDNWSKKEEIKL